MEKYINKLIRGFKRLFNKKYVAIVSIFVGIITVLGFTYGYLSEESGWQLATQLRVNDLYYTMTIDGDSASFVNVAANSGTTYHDIVITSLNDINTRYSLTYKSSINGVTVAASSSSENKQEGIIGLYTTGTATEKTKTIRVAITNNTANAAKVTFNVAGGYTWNPESQVAILSGYSRITNLFNERLIGYGLTLAEEINTILNCTPTASSPCYYIQNSNNYLTYAGNTWRIVGTYLVNDEYLVKLVLSDHISSKVTYSNVSSALTTFYNGLSDKSLIEGSAMSITKAEYDAIGGVNSYLYTKPDEEYWLGTQYYVGTSRGSSNLTSSATAYVRPAIFLKTDVVNANMGEYGTLINPYEIVQGKQLIFQYMDNASTNLLAGYYVPGQTYTLNNPTNSDSNYTFNKWEVSGTGASLSGTTFTMGTSITTLSPVWDVDYNYIGTYKLYTANADGYYFIETWGAQGGSAICNDVVCGTGGKGGYSSGYIYLNAGDKIYIYVGGKGNDAVIGDSIVTGGWNGGGQGTSDGADGEVSGAGGGATDIRYFGSHTPTASELTWDSTLGLNSRIMVSAGGAGSAWHENAGAGGGLIGTNAVGTKGASANVVQNALPGKQTGGYQFGIGQNGVGGGDDSDGVPGGGAGYYGGQSVSTKSGGQIENASGGSSFISGYAGSNAITSSTNRTHTNNTLHYSGKYFLNGTMKSGVNSGNGKAAITYVGSSLPRTNTSLNNVRYIKDCQDGNTSNVGKFWVEIQAIKDGTNIAKNKTITATGTIQSNYGAGTITAVVDGLMDDTDQYAGIGSSGTHCVTIDLGSTYNLDEIAVWNYYGYNRTYYNHVTSVSSDNSSWTTVINEIYPTSSAGKRVNAYSERLNGYVQDGLLVYYDGISNTGTTRSTTTTTWKNLASSSYNGTIANGTWGDNYLSFNGSSSWVNIAKMDLTNFTMDTVFKQNTTLTSWQDVIANWDDGGFGIGTKNNYFSVCVHYNGDYRCNTDTLALGTNNMYSYTTVFNQSLIKLYRGGGFIKDYTVGGPMTVAANNTVIALGTNPTGSTAQNEYLNGNIYSARIYNRALTADEIYHNYLVDKERFGLD